MNTKVNSVRPSYSPEILEVHKLAIDKARTALATAIYQSECGMNAGLRTIFSNQADWLGVVVYLASKQLEQELINETTNSKPAESLEYETTLCMEGPNQFKSVKYNPTCPHGYTDCVWDPAYIYATYPNWYKKLKGDALPTEVACEACLNGERYDDEDK